MSWIGSPVAANVIALGASVMAAAALLQPIWRKRAASIAVVYELYPDWAGSGQRHDRFVIVNDGAGVARDIEVTFWRNGGPVILSPESPLRPRIPLLHPGGTVAVEWDPSLSERAPDMAVVVWRDRRRGQQLRETPLSARVIQ